MEQSGDFQMQDGAAGLDTSGPTFGERFLRRLRKNRLAGIASVFVFLVAIMAIVAPFITPYSPTDQNLLRRLEPPSDEHWLGTDQLGRDILTRIAYGARVSLMIGLLGATGGMLCGVTLGTLSGFFGGTFDHLVMRVIDVMMSFPGILLAILIVSVLGPGTSNLIVALTIWFIPTFARISRGNVLSLKEMDFVESARSLGASNSRIMVQHVLLNIMSPIIVYMTLSVATSILTAAGMGFLGLGVQPPTAEWGIMISQGRQYLRDAPHLIMMPGAAIFITVLSINVVGDALRDVLDPKLKT